MLVCYRLFVGYSLSDGSPPFFLSYNQNTSNLSVDWVSMLFVCLFVLFVCLFVCLFVYYCYCLVTSITRHRTTRYPH